MPVPPLVQKHALNGVTALVFGLTIWRLGVSPELPAVLAFIFGGVLLAVIDWKVRQLPTRLVDLTLAVAVATCIRQRKLPLRYAFGPPLIAGSLAVVLFPA